jgi:hypothetical protein
MFAILRALGSFVVDLFKSRSRLEAENLFLRHQLNIALRSAGRRPRLRASDRILLIWMTKLWPSLLGAVQVVRPDTILRWHRAGFRMFWRWRSRNRAGRLRIDRGLRDLIRRIRTGRISRCGDVMLRSSLYEAALVVLTGPGRWNPLKAWGIAVARRRGMQKAMVAVARKLAIILHRMWRDDADFRWTASAA